MALQISRLIVQDYQSIGFADLALGKLTVIVGRGNLGKSALLRAMTAAIFNETGTDYIRHGTKDCRVELEFEGAKHVVWTKSATGGARYVIENPEQVEGEFTKLGASVPDAIRDFLAIQEIEIDKTFSIRPQVHGQFDSPILLAESSGKAARALAKLTKLEFVVKAQMAAARDFRRAKQDTTARAREIEELEARLAEFPDMLRLAKRMTRAHTSFAEADGRLNVLADAEEAFTRMEHATLLLATTPPTVRELDGLSDRLNTMINALIAQGVLSKAEIAYTRITHDMANLDQALAHDETNLQEYLDSLGTCPVCGKPMAKEHIDA